MSENAFSKNDIETLILCSLTVGDKYGYEIASEINSQNGESEIKQSTLYNYLKKLESVGLIESYWGEESNGGRRKYFRITVSGVSELRKIGSEISKNAEKTPENDSAKQELLIQSQIINEKNYTEKDAAPYVNKQNRGKYTTSVNEQLNLQMQLDNLTSESPADMYGNENPNCNNIKNENNTRNFSDNSAKGKFETDFNTDFEKQSDAGAVSGPDSRFSRENNESFHPNLPENKGFSSGGDTEKTSGNERENRVLGDNETAAAFANKTVSAAANDEAFGTEPAEKRLTEIRAQTERERSGKELYAKFEEKITENSQKPMTKENRQKENNYKHIMDSILGDQLKDESLHAESRKPDINLDDFSDPNLSALENTAEKLAEKGIRLNFYNKETAVYKPQAMLYKSKIDFVTGWLTYLSFFAVTLAVYFISSGALPLSVLWKFWLVPLVAPVTLSIIFMINPTLKRKPTFRFRYHFVNAWITFALLAVLILSINVLLLRIVFADLSAVYAQIVLPVLTALCLPISVFYYKLLYKKMLV